MAFRLLILFTALLEGLSPNPLRAAQVASSDCREWHQCRELALQAADRHDYETFHDLAWRTVQTGPPRDPDLMYLLARAQCLSGRPHDALVMLRRLAEMGVATDATVNPDFERSRALPGWTEVEALIAGVRNAAPGGIESNRAEAAPVPTPAPTTRNRRAATRPAANPPAAAAPTAPGRPPAAASSPTVPPIESAAAPTPPPAAPAAPVTPAAPTAVPPPPVAPVPSSVASPRSIAPTAPAVTQPATPAPETAAAPPAASAAAASSVNAPAAPAAAPTVAARRSRSTGLPAFKPLDVEEAVRVSTSHFAAAGLAYDAVSRRFVVGDLLGGRLLVVSEGSDHAVDLVRADSAGFHDIRAIEIDWRRGDLWVASATTDLKWSIHRLQLLSGRPLKAIQASKALEPLTIVDLAVTPGGTVLALDSMKGRLLVLRPRADALEAGTSLRVEGPTSVTASEEETIVYVAHRRGILRVDVRTGTTAAVTGPAGLDLTGIERIRWHETGLVASQTTSDGSRRLVQLELNSTRRAIRSAAVIDASLPSTSQPPFVTVSGDELSYLVAASPDATGGSERDPSASGQFIVRRIHLP